MLAAATTANYTNDTSPLTPFTICTLSASVAFGATVIVGLCGVICQPVSGILSDYLGRKPVMLVPLSLLLLVTLPSFAVIAHYRNAAALYSATFVLAGLLGLGSPACVTWLTESLPAHIRSGALSLVYAIQFQCSGGSTQFIAASLIEAHRQSAGAGLIYGGSHGRGPGRHGRDPRIGASKGRRHDLNQSKNKGAGLHEFQPSRTTGCAGSCVGIGADHRLRFQ